MLRKVIVSGPVNGSLVERQRDCGPGRARPTPSAHMNKAGGGGHVCGTKQPGSSGHRERGSTQAA